MLPPLQPCLIPARAGPASSTMNQPSPERVSLDQKVLRMRGVSRSITEGDAGTVIAVNGDRVHYYFGPVEKDGHNWWGVQWGMNRHFSEHIYSTDDYKEFMGVIGPFIIIVRRHIDRKGPNAPSEVAIRYVKSLEESTTVLEEDMREASTGKPYTARDVRVDIKKLLGNREPGTLILNDTSISLPDLKRILDAKDRTQEGNRVMTGQQVLQPSPAMMSREQIGELIKAKGGEIREKRNEIK